MSYFIRAEGQTPAYAGEHMRTARGHALALAAASQVNIIIARESVKGALRDVVVVHPDGSAEPPDGVKVDPREVCKRLQASAPCFCRVCRAERRKNR